MSPPSNVVLVPVGFAGRSGWHGVYSLLKKDGRNVITDVGDDPDVAGSEVTSQRSSRTEASQAASAGDVIIVPEYDDEMLVKTVQLGHGGFVLTVTAADNSAPDAQRVLTLTATTPVRRLRRIPAR